VVLLLGLMVAVVVPLLQSPACRTWSSWSSAGSRSEPWRSPSATVPLRYAFEDGGIFIRAGVMRLRLAYPDIVLAEKVVSPLSSAAWSMVKVRLAAGAGGRHRDRATRPRRLPGGTGAARAAAATDRARAGGAAALADPGRHLRLRRLGQVRRHRHALEPLDHAVLVAAHEERAAQALGPDPRVELAGLVDEREAALLEEPTE
jgi:hypothetical protein